MTEANIQDRDSAKGRGLFHTDAGPARTEAYLRLVGLNLALTANTVWLIIPLLIAMEVASIVSRNGRSRQRLNCVVVGLVAMLVVASCTHSGDEQPFPNNTVITAIDVGALSSGEEFVLVGTLRDGSFATFDGGETFMAAIGIPDSAAILDFAVSADGQTSFAATNRGLFESNDSGRSWATVDDQSLNHFEFDAVREVEMSVNSEYENLIAIVATTKKSGPTAFMSYDGGRNWESPFPGYSADVELLNDGRFAIAVSKRMMIRKARPLGNARIFLADWPVIRVEYAHLAADEGILFYGGTGTSTLHRLDTASGESMDLRLQLFSADYLCGSDIDWSVLGRDTWCWHDGVVLSPDFQTDGIGFVVSDEGLFRSDDQGMSWSGVKLPIDDDEVIVDVVFARHQANRILIATSRHIIVSDDAGNSFHMYDGG